MTTRALGWGGVAATALMAFYVSVLAASGGWAHLADQAQSDWWLLAPIAVASGAQVNWRIPLMAGGLAINLAAVAVAGRRLFHLTHPTRGSVSCAA